MPERRVGPVSRENEVGLGPIGLGSIVSPVEKGEVGLKPCEGLA